MVFHDIFAAVEAAELTVAQHDVVEQDHHDLVAVDELIFALVVADHAADAVGVGIGCEDDIGGDFLALGYGHGHGGCIFGIGGVDGGEIA